MTPDRAEARAKTVVRDWAGYGYCHPHHPIRPMRECRECLEDQIDAALRAVAQDCAEVAKQHRVQSFGKVTIKALEELLQKESGTPLRIEPSGEVLRICQCNEQIETAIRARWGVKG